MKHATAAACMIAVLTLCTQVRTAHAQTLEISWDEPAAATITGYRVYFGTMSGLYDVSTDIGHSTSYAFADPNDGAMHYIALSAYTADGLESSLSQEIAFVASAAQEPDDPVEPEDPSTPGVTLITTEPQIAGPHGQFRDLSTDPFCPTEISADDTRTTIIRWNCAVDLLAFVMRRSRTSMPAPYLHMWQFRAESEDQWSNRPVRSFLWWAWVVNPQDSLGSGSYEFRVVVADSEGAIDYSATYYLLIE